MRFISPIMNMEAHIRGHELNALIFSFFKQTFAKAADARTQHEPTLPTEDESEHLLWLEGARVHRIVKRALLIGTIELSSLIRSREFAVSPERGPFSF